MAEHLVAPLGTCQFARWWCNRCITIGASGLTGDAAREQAAAHVRLTGHATEIERGSRELLAPVATAVPRREVTAGAQA